MAHLMGVALTELITALIIWALIERFGHVARDKGKLRSFGVFLGLWVAVVALHLYVMPYPMEGGATAAEAPKATDTIPDQDAATLESHKPELQAIVRQVAQGGTVDQQTHDHFWSLIPASLWSTPERRQATLGGIDEGMGFQKAFWLSVLLSAQSHQVVKTEAYEKALSQGDPAAASKGEAILQAAATGAPYALSNGQGSRVITADYAQQVLAGLDASAGRLKILFDPAWHAP